MARGDRAAAERASVSRLERADHGRVLPAEHRGARPRRRRTRSSRSSTTTQRMSFNVGPTLMSWLEEHAPDVHAALVDADRASRERFGGHGSAMAQAYNHMIMPLASARDQRDAGALGHRRLRAPVRPRARGHVAARVRGRYAERSRRWRPRASRSRCSRRTRRRRGGRRAASGARRAVDPGRAYKYKLPSGTIDRSVLLRRPDLAGGRVRAAARRRPQIISRMTARGARRGRRADAVSHRDRRRDLRPPSPLRRHGARVGAVAGRAGLERHAAHELRRVPREGARRRGRSQIVENTSWSCAHGIARWRERLRLQQRRRAGLEPEVAAAAARRARLAARAGARDARAASAACCSTIRGPRATRTSTCCSSGADGARAVPRDARDRTRSTPTSACARCR